MLELVCASSNKRRCFWTETTTDTKLIARRTCKWYCYLRVYGVLRERQHHFEHLYFSCDIAISYQLYTLKESFPLNTISTNVECSFYTVILIQVRAIYLLNAYTNHWSYWDIYVYDILLWPNMTYYQCVQVSYMCHYGCGPMTLVIHYSDHSTRCVSPWYGNLTHCARQTCYPLEHVHSKWHSFKAFKCSNIQGAGMCRLW